MTTNSEPHGQAFAYAEIETPGYERWRIVGPHVFGRELAPDEPDGAVRRRTHERHHRLAVNPGGRNRLDEHNVPITMTFGRHPNDRMFSLYARVSGGFEVAYGWGALRIDDEAGWKTTEFENISELGHKMQDVGMPGMIEVLQNA